MIKIFLTLLFSISLNCTFGQTVAFKTSYFDSNKQLQNVKFDTIELFGFIDIDFYRKHFFKPYHYPKHFVNNEYSDTIVVRWNNDESDKDFYSNWTYTYVFDTLSRVVEYKYSGCFVCSQLPYTVQISYDNQNRPVILKKGYYNTSTYILKGKEDEEEEKETWSEAFELFYNLTGEIVMIKIYIMGNLTEQIEKI
jgi:hypothetical protein